MEYDGSINIDTHIDTRGFNKDADKIGKSLGKVMKVIKSGLTVAAGTAAALAGILVVVGLAAAGIVRGFIGMIQKARALTQTLYSTLSPTSAMRDEVTALQAGFDAVKGSVMALGATILHAVAPILMRIINLLVQGINFVAMFIASLAGLETIMVYTSGAVEEAMKGAGGLADEMERAKGAAEGALAPFDELNVLAQEAERGPSGGGPGIGGPIQMEEVEVPADFAQQAWQTFLDWWGNDFTPQIKERWREMWTGVVAWVLNKILDLIAWIPTLFMTIGDFVAGVWDWIKEKAKLAWTAIIEFAKNRWNAFVTFYGGIINRIVQWGSNLKSRLVQKFWETVDRIKEIWGNIKEWFRTTIWDPITQGFSDFLGGIYEAFVEKFNAIKDWVKLALNTIIRFLNAMLAGLVKGVNTAIRALNSLQVTIPDWVPLYGGRSWGLNLGTLTAPKIPELARGAVIPPNQPFAAVLGEQRVGRNIEAPEGLIRDIIRDEMGNIQGDFKIEFGGSMGELVRVLKPYIDKEDVRVGDSLIQRRTL